MSFLNRSLSSGYTFYLKKAWNMVAQMYTSKHTLMCIDLSRKHKSMETVLHKASTKAFWWILRSGKAISVFPTWKWSQALKREGASRESGAMTWPISGFGVIQWARDSSWDACPSGLPKRQCLVCTLTHSCGEELAGVKCGLLSEESENGKAESNHPSVYIHIGWEAGISCRMSSLGFSQDIQ